MRAILLLVMATATNGLPEQSWTFHHDSYESCVRDALTFERDTTLTHIICIPITYAPAMSPRPPMRPER